MYIRHTKRHRYPLFANPLAIISIPDCRMEGLTPQVDRWFSHLHIGMTVTAHQQSVHFSRGGPAQRDITSCLFAVCLGKQRSQTTNAIHDFIVSHACPRNTTHRDSVAFARTYFALALSAVFSFRITHVVVTETGSTLLKTTSVSGLLGVGVDQREVI